MNSLVSKTHLSTLIGENKYIDKVYFQLQKDIFLTGLDEFEIDIEKLNYPVFQEKFTDYIKPLILNNPEAIRNFLYRIDLNENKLINDYLNFEQESFTRNLSMNIIQRELVKVLLKEKYKSED